MNEQNRTGKAAMSAFISRCKGSCLTRTVMQQQILKPPARVCRDGARRFSDSNVVYDGEMGEVASQLSRSVWAYLRGRTETRSVLEPHAPSERRGCSSASDSSACGCGCAGA